MPPQNAETESLIHAEDDFALVPEDEHEHGDELEERHFEFSIKAIISDLRNLDYSKVVWRNTILFVLLHIYSVQGLYLAITSCTWKTLGFSYSLYLLSAMGITMGVHRLWSHRSYKAKLPLRIFLAVCNSMAFQNSIFEWSRDHRAHHKYSETDADPHNAQRGFFFSHMGWLMYKKHPDVKEKGKNLDVSDLMADPVVRIQHEYYKSSVLLCCFVIPVVIPMYFWNESFVNSLMVAGFLRYCVGLHITWLVNSLAHWIGAKPFDKTIYPSQNKIVAALALGEGWHNYHHVFPFDYRTSEFGGFSNLNVTARIISLLAKTGLAYDLKTATSSIAVQRAIRTGDGSYSRKEKKVH